MPTDEENVKFLYLVLNEGGTPTIDFDKVGGELDLKKGATTKRWSRLKAAINEGKNPGPSAYQFLWLCMKHSTREHATDWNVIAKACDTTNGAASKRYSRLKQAFERGGAITAVTEKKAADMTNGDSTGAKRKRKPATQKSKITRKDPASEDEAADNGETTNSGIKKEVGSNDEEAQLDDFKATPKPKRARTATPSKAKKNTAKAKKELITENIEGYKDATGNPELLAELEAAVHAAGGETHDEFFDAEELAYSDQSEESKTLAQNDD